MRIFAITSSYFAPQPVPSIDFHRHPRAVGDGWVDPQVEIRFNCKEGKFNEVALIIFGHKEEVIKEIIANPHNFKFLTLLTCFLILFPLQILAMGTAVPAGIFMPSILTGSVMGGFFGHVVKYTTGTAQSGPYGLLGAVAMLGGIQRTTISLCVIMMEGTGQTSFILPIILTTGEYIFENVVPIPPPSAARYSLLLIHFVPFNFLEILIFGFLM